MADAAEHYAEAERMLASLADLPTAGPDAPVARRTPRGGDSRA